MLHNGSSCRSRYRLLYRTRAYIFQTLLQHNDWSCLMSCLEITFELANCKASPEILWWLISTPSSCKTASYFPYMTFHDVLAVGCLFLRANMCRPSRGDVCRDIAVLMRSETCVAGSVNLSVPTPREMLVSTRACIQYYIGAFLTTCRHAPTFSSGRRMLIPTLWADSTS